MKAIAFCECCSNDRQNAGMDKIQGKFNIYFGSLQTGTERNIQSSTVLLKNNRVISTESLKVKYKTQKKCKLNEFPFEMQFSTTSASISSFLFSFIISENDQMSVV